MAVANFLILDTENKIWAFKHGPKAMSEATKKNSNPMLKWSGEGIPFSKRFGDIYFSKEDGLEEARYVFLKGNYLPKAWRSRESFVICETGFGAGLNFLATWKLWDATKSIGAKLHYISVERYPLTSDEIEKCLSSWPELACYAAQLRLAYPVLEKGINKVCFQNGKVLLTILFGEVVEMLSSIECTADAWFLDGFSPSKNPSMWRPEVFNQMARLSRVGTSAATFSAAKVVKERLHEVGFLVLKRPGYGRKREMITAVFSHK
tara:strand:+ start:32 stop:820 length:789 start_codon:yes stop_codon:yes gene_type:complete